MVRLHLDNKKYKVKPDKLGTNELRNLTKRSCLEIKDLTMKEIAQGLAQGQTAVLGVMSSYDKRNDNLMTQDLIALDFDNDTVDLFYRTIDDALNDSFIKDNASFLYTTFSHTEEHHKYRVVFKLNRTLTNNEQVSKLYFELLKKYPEADQSIKDSSRFFFGGKEYYEINFDNTLDPYTVVEELPADTPIKERVEEFKEEYKKDYKKKKKTKTDNVIELTDNQVGNVIPTYKLIRIDKKIKDEKVAQSTQLLNDEEVKRRWKQYGFDTENSSSALTEIKKINMRELLGLPESGNFHDIFTPDKSPSANIQKVKDGETYLYFRASGDKSRQFTGDIVKVVQKLRGCNFMTALHYIIDMMGITFGQSEEVKRIQEKINIFTATLRDDDLKVNYPNMYYTFERFGYGAEIERLLNIISKSVVEKDGKVQILSQFSAKELSQRMYKTPNQEKKVKKYLNLLALTDFVKKLQDHELDEELLSKLEEYKTQKNNDYRKNIISIHEYGDDFLEDGERKCGELKQFKFTVKEGLTREWVLRHYGKAKADEVFPLDTERMISRQNRNIYDLCVQYASEEISNKGFVTEQDIIKKIARTKKIKKAKAEFKWKQLRFELCEAYGFEITTLNKDLKKEFNVSGKYGTQRPNIIKLAQ